VCARFDESEGEIDRRFQDLANTFGLSFDLTLVFGV
jgi:hypothetical protein